MSSRIWNTGYNAAKNFYEDNGHLRVAAKFTDKNDYSLGVWLSGQRRLFKKNKLSQDRIVKLNQIKMEWNGTGNRTGKAICMTEKVNSELEGY